MLIDPDRFEARNLETHDIDRDAVGAPKVAVLSARIAQIDPTIEVVPIGRRVEDVPMGLLRGAILVSCPDSRRARQAVNLIACRLGVPWVDAGVDGGGGLARVTVRAPSPCTPCLLCGWSPEDHMALAHEYSCAGREGEVSRTGAPSWLGAMAASLLASECGRLLEGHQRPGGWQWVIDAGSGIAVTTLFRRNPDCRFDHAAWDIQWLNGAPQTVSLADAFALRAGEAGIEVEGRCFVRRVRCSGCGQSKEVLCLSDRLAPDECRCRLCGDGRLEPLAFYDATVLDRSAVASGSLGSLTLADIGFLPADVFAIGGVHYGLGGRYAG
jgi:hypothetical protein